MNSAILTKASGALGRFSFKVQKASPQLYLAGGIIGGIATVVMACIATHKAEPVIADTKERISVIHDDLENEEITKEESSKALFEVYKEAAIDLVKLYAPSIFVGGLSITCVLVSNGIMRSRNMSLVAAYSALEKTYKGYRSKIAERFGKEVDEEVAHDISYMDEEAVTGEKGKKDASNVVQVTGDPTKYSPYARFFDEYNPNWEKSSEYNLMFLRSMESRANDLLQSQGFLTLNEVYEMLGMEKSNAGMVVGWTYLDPEVGVNPHGDNYVSFGIYDVYKKGARDFVNGYERSILLDFNVDGVIYDLI